MHFTNRLRVYCRDKGLQEDRNTGEIRSSHPPKAGIEVIHLPVGVSLSLQRRQAFRNEVKSCASLSNYINVARHPLRISSNSSPGTREDFACVLHGPTCYDQSLVTEMVPILHKEKDTGNVNSCELKIHLLFPNPRAAKREKKLLEYKKK